MATNEIKLGINLRQNKNSVAAASKRERKKIKKNRADVRSVRFFYVSFTLGEVTFARKIANLFAFSLTYS